MASFCASETAETGRIANGREQGDHVSRRRRRKKDLIGLVRSCCLCGLNRGLENLDSPFGKVLILLVRGRCLGVLIRGFGNLELPERVRFYSFRLYEKNGEYPRGLRTSGLRGGFKALSKKILAELPAVRVEPGFRHKTAAKRL